VADPQCISFEEFMKARVLATVDHREEVGTQKNDVSGLAERQESILTLVASWIGPERLLPLRNAIHTGSPVATSALGLIDIYIRETCEQLIERAKVDKSRANWKELNCIANLATYFAMAGQDRPRMANAYYFLAKARRELGDDSSVIEFYSLSIKSAQGLLGSKAIVGNLAIIIDAVTLSSQNCLISPSNR